MTRNKVLSSRNNVPPRGSQTIRQKKDVPSSNSSPTPTRPTKGASLSHPNLKMDESYYDNKDFGSMWLSEFLSYEKTRNETLAKADLMNFTKLPGSTVHPHAEKHLNQKSKGEKKKASSGGKLSTMSDNERKRLNELSRTLLGKKGNCSAKSKATKKFTPYVEANTKISRVLKHTKLKTNTEDMQASQLDDFYKLVSTETNAAIMVQSQCRRVLATKYARRFALETKMATKIEAAVRGLLARRLLQKMQEERRNAFAARERFVRVYVARYRRRKRVEFENRAATLGQSAIRMHFAKCLLRMKKLQFSWELNQRRWRGLSIRLAWKHLRIYFYARQIQTVVRRKLAQKRFILTFTINTEAAVRIQCLWRCYAAQQRKLSILYELRVEQQCKKIRIIASEHRYWKQRLEDLTMPPKLQHLKDLEERENALQLRRTELREQIRVLEVHYRDQLNLLQRVTPRSIAGGWEDQIKVNLKDTRERITTAKLDLLFDVQKHCKENEKQLIRVRDEMKEAEECEQHWRQWHQMEQDRLWDIQREHDRNMERKMQQHNRVNEQMRWAVDFFMPSGKPDKRRPLLHLPSDANEMIGSGNKVQQLTDVVKLRADEFQAQQHLACTFQPFQRVWDKCNELGMSDGSQNLFQKKRRMKGYDAMQLSNNAKNGQMSLVGREYSWRDSRAQTKRTVNPKLPWNLMDDVRSEKQAIKDKYAVELESDVS